MIHFVHIETSMKQTRYPITSFGFSLLHQEHSSNSQRYFQLVAVHKRIPIYRPSGGALRFPVHHLQLNVSYTVFFVLILNEILINLCTDVCFVGDHPLHHFWCWDFLHFLVSWCSQLTPVGAHDRESGMARCSSKVLMRWISVMNTDVLYVKGDSNFLYRVWMLLSCG